MYFYKKHNLFPLNTPRLVEEKQANRNILFTMQRTDICK
jgi:hypothetical protein